MVFHRFAFALICAILCSLSMSPTFAQESAFQAVSVGEGPVLYFDRPEDSQGNPESDNGEKRINASYVLDPLLHKTPQRLWAGTGRLPDPIAFVSPGVLVVTQDDRSFLLSMKDAKTTDLLATKHSTEVVSVEDGKVFFKEHLPSPYFPCSTLVVGPDNIARSKSCPGPRDRLYVLDYANSQPAKRLADVEIDSILHEDETSFWVITAGKDLKGRKLCRISKAGGIEEIIPFDDQWVTSLTEFEIAPKKKYFALAYAHERHDFWKERGVVVVNIDTKKIIFSQEKATASTLPFSGSPYLGIGWLDEKVLNFGVVEVVDVVSGKRSNLFDTMVKDLLLEPVPDGQDEAPVAKPPLEEPPEL